MCPGPIVVVDVFRQELGKRPHSWSSGWTYLPPTPSPGRQVTSSENWSTMSRNDAAGLDRAKVRSTSTASRSPLRRELTQSVIRSQIHGATTEYGLNTDCLTTDTRA